MNQSRLIFVGAGPANLLPILHLLQNGFEGQITLIDKGKDIFDRPEDDLLMGFGGAGTFSDNKNIFSDHKDQPIFEYTTLEKIKEYYTFIQQMITDFHPNPKEINISLPEKNSLEKYGVKDAFKSGWGEMAIKQSTTWHVGSTNGKIVLENWFKYMVDRGVNMMFNTEFMDIIDSKVITDKGSLVFDKCYLALGKVGKKKVQEFYKKHKIKSNIKDMNLGVRFETPYDSNNTIKEVVSKQYDFKYSKDLTPDKNIRTFCSCHGSSQVVAEDFNNTKRVNGHGYGLHVKEKWSGNSNFGIMICEKTDGDKTINDIVKKYPNGFVVRNDDDFNETITTDLPTISLNEFKSTYGVYADDICNFISDLENILNIKKWRFYGPEIKESSNRANLGEDLELLDFPNVYALGDSGIGTRGIVPAAVSGLIAVESLI